jgi:hypothetical protein
MIVVAAVPGFAQSNTVSRSNTGSALIAMRTPSVVRVYESERAATTPRARLPLNLTFPDGYRELIESMLERSPTFRRQCLRIANASGLTITIRTLHPYAAGTARARTDIVRADGGRMIATVFIGPLHDVAELIGHELEHIIEQIDGVDLRVRSAVPGTGVHVCVDGSFETIRAVRTGVLVARETRARR